MSSAFVDNLVKVQNATHPPPWESLGIEVEGVAQFDGPARLSLTVFPGTVVGGSELEMPKLLLLFFFPKNLLLDLLSIFSIYNWPERGNRVYGLGFEMSRPILQRRVYKA